MKYEDDTKVNKLSSAGDDYRRKTFLAYNLYSAAHIVIEGDKHVMVDSHVYCKSVSQTYTRLHYKLGMSQWTPMYIS